MEQVRPDVCSRHPASACQPDAWIPPLAIGRYANNRAENSHLPFRRRERAMLRFRQLKSLQKFASVRGSIHNHLNQDRHLIA